jgi:hypothetical protein
MENSVVGSTTKIAKRLRANERSAEDGCRPALDHLT